MIGSLGIAMITGSSISRSGSGGSATGRCHVRLYWMCLNTVYGDEEKGNGGKMGDGGE